uniref:Uncharacterized protein n=1 Tax=mine drainage metagenome TaxID=410659 RepID=E6QJP5_9ZZZZ
MLMLVCAALASMGFGVFSAYGLCKAGFTLMRWHTARATQQTSRALNSQTSITPLS